MIEMTRVKDRLVTDPAGTIGEDACSRRAARVCPGRSRRVVPRDERKPLGVGEGSVRGSNGASAIPSVNGGSDSVPGAPVAKSS